MEYLGKGAKRDLNSEETKKLGKPEGQFKKFALKDNHKGPLTSVPYKLRSYSPMCRKPINH